MGRTGVLVTGVLVGGELVSAGMTVPGGKLKNEKEWSVVTNSLLNIAITEMDVLTQQSSA